MRRAARDVVQPEYAQLCAMIDEAGAYRAAWLVGLRREPFGPAFTRPRDVFAFVDLIAGGTTR